MNAYLKFGEILSICSQDIERNKMLDYIKGHNSGKNLWKMMQNDPKLDLVIFNAYLKFGETQFVQDIEQK